jgi:hypothetical protein
MREEVLYYTDFAAIMNAAPQISMMTLAILSDRPSQGDRGADSVGQKSPSPCRRAEILFQNHP